MHWIQRRPLGKLLRLMPCQLCGLDHQQQHTLCEDCWRDLPWFKDRIYRQQCHIMAACHYRFPIDRIIQKYKYEQQLHYQTLLTHCLLNLNLPRVDAIVAMPISQQRLIERGYNQMLIIAKRLAAACQLPLWQPVIRTAQHSQKGLSRLERLEAIEQQFKIIPTQYKRYQKVLLLDDVVTTGSSLAAMQHALQRLGCTEIELACIAMASPKMLASRES